MILNLAIVGPMSAAQTTINTDVCILGGGPHGLTAAVHLHQAAPNTRIVAIDPSGQWLSTWRQQFACAEIPTLRSPIVHHPAPASMALRDHLVEHKLERSGLPYDLPTTETFDSFCQHLIDAADFEPPLATKAEQVSRNGPGVAVETDAGTVLADHLIVATNPHTRVIPDWTWPVLGVFPNVFSYGADVDLRSIDVDGQLVTVVGGGLTAAHLTCGAAERGAEVHVVSRRPLRDRPFDTDPGWLGPKYLREFEQLDDPAARLNRSKEARGGGTIPPWMRERMDELVDDGQVIIHDGADVRAAQSGEAGGYRLALGDHTTLDADRVWLATGTKPDITALRCLADLVADEPVIDGYPIIGPDLRLGSHPIFLMGRIATVQLGPAAGNLWGAQRASERITEAVVGHPVATY